MITLITGGSRGLGKSMALRVGGDVVLTYQKNEGEAAKVVDAVTKQGRRAWALRFDAGDSKSFGAFAEQVAAIVKGEKLDALVNNAGMAGYAPFAQTSEEMLDGLYAAHFKGPFLLTQKLLPLLAERAHILNISSGLARFTNPGYSAYGAMKAAIEHLTRYMAAELAPRRVNVVAPGAIATDFGGGHVRDNPELNKAIASRTALGRVGEADDIGAAVAKLLAPELGWMTGQRIELSGGMNL